MFRFWRDLSVVKKLYVVVGVMAFLVAMELLTLLFAMNTLSTLRAFVGGESSWSKAQKNAIHDLYLYMYTKDESFYDGFNKNLSVNMSLRQARLELQKPNFDEKLVTDYFVKGTIAESDVPGVVNMLRRFHSAPYIGHALQVWAQADALLDDLIDNARTLHELIKAGQFDSPETKSVVARTHELNIQLSILEDDFSATLGSGSRWLEHILMVILIIAVMTVEGTGILLTISFNRNLSRSLTEISQAAKDLGEGNLSQSVPVRSNDELGQLAQTLNKMTQDLDKSIVQRVRAENASQIKTLFLANMSHEIRTPLGVIIGLTEIIKDPDLNSDERLKYIQIIENTGRNLTRIINDILDITKVESGHLQIQRSEVNVPEVLKEISSMMSIKAKEHDNTFEVVEETAVPNFIQTDRSRLNQILLNLVNNAIKFTQDGLIQIRYGMNGDLVYFDVFDTGIGIPEESKKDLFKTFSQIDSSSTHRYEGTGLGLVLSKRIAQSLGGDVVLLRSELGRGSTFRITISKDSQAEPAPKMEPIQPVPSAVTHADHLIGKKVLIVDDSNDNQLLIQLYLKKRGIHSEFADNGAAAVHKALTNNYDLVLMDMQMPIMDGYTATQTLREKGFKKPIIALTAHAMMEDRNRCLAAGCNDYLTKPIDSNILFKTVLTYVT